MNFIVVMNSIGVCISILSVIWLAAVKITRLEVKVDPMWRWFLRNQDRRNRNSEENDRNGN